MLKLATELQTSLFELKHKLDAQSSKHLSLKLNNRWKSDASRPRPIIIKFLQSTEVTLTLTKIASFQFESNQI